MKRSHLAQFLPLILLSLLSCQSPAQPPVVQPLEPEPSIVSWPPEERYMDTLLCEGFDLPISQSNSVTISSAISMVCWQTLIEKKNAGIPATNSKISTAHPVYAIGKGKVLATAQIGGSWKQSVMLQHAYLDNGKYQLCYSLYAGLDSLLVRPGQLLNKKTRLGYLPPPSSEENKTILYVEIRSGNLEESRTEITSVKDLEQKWHKEEFFTFIRNKRTLLVPCKEKVFLLSIKSRYKTFLFHLGRLDTLYDIALSQDPYGHKQKQGDNKLPEGEYRILDKQLGPFPGELGPWLGKAWMRISYPNDRDAEQGYAMGLISEAEKKQIQLANKLQQIPPHTTSLGGGIGIHGWAYDWEADGQQNLTWGCMSMKSKDLLELYHQVPSGTKIVILP